MDPSDTAPFRPLSPAQWTWVAGGVKSWHRIELNPPGPATGAPVPSFGLAEPDPIDSARRADLPDPALAI